MMGWGMSDNLLRWDWAAGGNGVARGPGGSPMDGSGDDVFVWRHGRAEVVLSRAGDAWAVVYRTAGRLLGPPQVLWDARHTRAKMAAWDVMARVTQASRDEDEGVRVGRRAAQWMHAARVPDETDD